MRTTSIDSVAAEQQRFMVRVYNWMGAGLGITGVMAFYIANTPAIFNVVMGNPIMPIVLIIAQIGLVFWLATRVMQMSVSQATGVFSIICRPYWYYFFHFICGLYICVNHIDLYSNGRHIWSNEFLWLHDKKGPNFLGEFSIYGTNRNNNSFAR